MSHPARAEGLVNMITLHDFKLIYVRTIKSASDLFLILCAVFVALNVREESIKMFLWYILARKGFECMSIYRICKKLIKWRNAESELKNAWKYFLLYKESSITLFIFLYSMHSLTFSVYIYIYIYIYIFILSSLLSSLASSLSRTASTDFLDTFLSFVILIHPSQ